MRISSRSLVLALLCLPLALPAAAKLADPDDGHWCGTTRFGSAGELAVNRRHNLDLGRDRADDKALPSTASAFQEGGVAVIEDDGSILIQPNQQDVANSGIQYAPQKKGGYVVSPSSDPVLEDLGDQLALGDDDTHAVTLPKGFKFKFYGKVYTKMFVQSDGNLTFVAPDADSSERDLSRLLGGPPRIAPLFADLNPERAGAGGIFVKGDKTKVVVTWLDLPDFGGTTPHNTFQAVLYATGRITFAFGRLDAKEALVGISPGGGAQATLVDYAAGDTTAALKTAIAERFTTTQALDNLAIANAFFGTFADDYDHVVVFLDFQQSLGQAFAFEINIKNEVGGIGLDLFDFSKQAGSKGRLRSFVQMGTLAHYPEDPNVNFLGTNNSLDLLGQETGHRWLAFMSFMNDAGEPSNALLGRQDAHWNFCANSFASDMEGNEIREDGGDRFTTVASTDHYSPLDMYAMGLIPPSDVEPFFYVDGCFNKAAPPEIGVGMSGPRVPVTVEQIIAADGPRTPAWNKAPHTFNMAFILVTEGGGPSDGAVAKVDRMRAAWEPYFAAATNGKGTVSTALKLKPRH